MFHRRMMMWPAGGVSYETIAISVADANGANVTSRAITGGNSGDLLVMMAHDTSGMTSPGWSGGWISEGTDTDNTAVATRVLSSDDESVTLPASGVHASWVAGTGFAVKSVTHNNGTGTTITFPSATVDVPGSYVYLSAFRESSGGMGTLSSNTTGATILQNNGSLRQALLGIADTAVSFSGGTVDFPVSSDWACVVVVLEPIA